MGVFERFLSRRYLFTRQRRWLVSVITLISIAGVMVGVAALMIVLGVIEGLDKDIFGKIVEINPHMKIKRADRRPLADPQPILDLLAQYQEVALAEPVVDRQVLFIRHRAGDTRSVPGQLIGVAQLGRNQVYPISVSRDGSNIKLKGKEVLLGAPLAHQLGINWPLIDPIEITVRTGILRRTPIGRQPRTRNLKVLGIYQTGMPEFDAVTAFVSNETARRSVFGLGDADDYIHVKLNDAFRVRALKESLMRDLGPDYAISTWEEENGEFFQALRLEKLGLVVILLLVVFVASFNIVGMLILMVIDKKQEIGILKAIGATDAMIRNTFMSAGSLIGLIGTILGLAFGFAGCYLVKNVIPINTSPSVFSLNHLPVVIKTVNVVVIAMSAILISLMAAVFPAIQAGRLNPIDALKEE